MFDGGPLPVHWSRTQNVRWSAELPGWGTSSPVAYRGCLYVTSEVEEPEGRSLLTHFLDCETGRELWRHDFGLGVDQRTHEKSNLAANTPAVVDDAVYVAFGNADVARYTHDGELVWVTRYMEIFGDPKMAWGYNVSPLVLDDSVLFPWDHHKGPCYLVGLDKQTGKIAWKQERPIGTAHATPLLVRRQGHGEILVSGKNRLTAFDAATHEQLWTYGEGEGPFNGEIIVSPIYSDGIVFTQLWRQSPIHALRLAGGSRPPEQLWTSQKPGPQEPTPVYYGGFLYVWMDNGILSVLDGGIGEEVYRKRLGAVANSSPIAGDGHVYLSDIEGVTYVIEAGPEFKLASTNRLEERITASPAVSENRLFYRTDSRLYCIG